ncbi:MAG: hypothetical protein RIK87_25335 [Fuerstiella sp.]
MPMPPLRSPGPALICCFSALSLISGCLHPGMYYGRPYGQPMYAPPQSLNPGNPGTLYIPESSDQPYAPGGGTYDTDPDDDFRRSDDEDQFFNPDGGVPLPNDRKSPFYGDDDLGPSTQLIPESEPVESTVARPVALTSGTSLPVEYGFDTAEYRWLRGIVRQDPETGRWGIIYSLAGNDRFGGQLLLQATPAQLSDLRDGDPVDVSGRLATTTDGSGMHFYDVEQIRMMATRIAM